MREWWRESGSASHQCETTMYSLLFCSALWYILETIRVLNVCSSSGTEDTGLNDPYGSFPMRDIL